MDKLQNKLSLIDSIKRKIDTLSFTCARIRTLNNVFIMYAKSEDDKVLLIDLESLKGSWDVDRRIALDDGLIAYVDFKNHKLLTIKKKEINLYKLDDKDLIRVFEYLSMYISKEVKTFTIEDMQNAFEDGKRYGDHELEFVDEDKSKTAFVIWAEQFIFK